jgi:hypothetical protein
MGRRPPGPARRLRRTLQPRRAGRSSIRSSRCAFSNGATRRSQKQKMDAGSSPA